VTFQLKSRDYLGHPFLKRKFNQELFEEVAPRYAFITRVLSLGRDRAWKRRLVAQLPALARPRCLDLACGTGDMALLLQERYPEARITGLDLTPAMIDLARTRRGADRIEFVVGDMCATSWPDASADIITGGYALRNAPSLDRALYEIHRVLRTGGVAAFLDFSKPPHRIGQFLTHQILRLWGGLWGLAVHGNPEVYTYLAHSLRQFPNRRDLRALLERQGFRVLYRRLHYAGIIEAMVVEKV
jgi:ubiquinone/menaquinone biosynthesis methyltransferase